jgi:hypothetical protein
VSGIIVRRRPWWRIALRALPLAVAVGLAGTLAAALQVREVRVSGTTRFPAREVERVLGAALGTPAVAARPEALRALVRELPWVEDAHVRVSLDGVVTCAVSERVPVAVAVDGSARQLVDAAGNLLGPAAGTHAALEIDAFGPHPGERADLLARIPDLERAWGGRLARAVRVGPRDVELGFEGAPCAVVADPAAPNSVATARRVLTAWTASHDAAPRRLDVRVPGRVAVLPAPPPEPAAGEVS